MKHRAETLATRLTGVLASWPAVECVMYYGASADDTIDPYFALVLDVYVDGDIPPDEARQAAFGDPGAFESSRNRGKDRFFLDGLPIRLEYKQRSRVDRVVDSGLNVDELLKSGGPYLMHRVVEGTVLYSRGQWIHGVRSAMATVPDGLWQALRETYQFRMEHTLSDLGGAALKNDHFFFHIALAGFLRATASALFALNRRWEPSERNLSEALLALPKLPEDFPGRWGMLTRVDASLNPERVYQLAQLVVRSMFALA